MALQVLNYQQEGLHQAYVTVGSQDPQELNTKEARELAQNTAARQGMSRPGFSSFEDCGYLTTDGRNLSDAELMQYPRPEGLHYRRIKIQGSI